MECISCKKDVDNIVRFPCPLCSEEIVRCQKCRSLSVEYRCKNCNRRGP